MAYEKTEVACTECGARRFLTGDAVQAMEAARAYGWRDAERQLPGRHVAWMVCPQHEAQS